MWEKNCSLLLDITIQCKCTLILKSVQEQAEPSINSHQDTHKHTHTWKLKLTAMWLAQNDNFNGASSRVVVPGVYESRAEPIGCSSATLMFSKTNLTWWSENVSKHSLLSIQPSSTTVKRDLGEGQSELSFVQTIDNWGILTPGLKLSRLPAVTIKIGG